MQRSKIEWTDYSLNPVRGLCPVDCKDNQGKSYCYARKLYRRFKWEEEIDWCPRVFRELDKLKPGSRIFIGSTMELFGPWVKDIWMQLTFEEVVLHPDLTFIFLTKCPERLLPWSPYPSNVHIGVSVTNQEMFEKAMKYLPYISAKVKFLSIEPMLSRILTTPGQLQRYIGLIILGSQTQPMRQPGRAWVQDIIAAADQAGVPVFVKEPMATAFGIQRKEFPQEG